MDPQGWRVELSRQAERDLRRVPPGLLVRLRDAIRGLTSNPWIGDIKKLEGAANRYRLRVGDWRIIFVPDHDTQTIVVTDVRPRGSAYRG